MIHEELLVKPMTKNFKIIYGIIIVVIALSVGLILNQGDDIPENIEPTTSEDRPVNLDFLNNSQTQTKDGSLTQEAKLLFLQDQYEEAVDMYLASYEEDKRSILPFLGIAEIYLQTGKNDLAQENLLIAQKAGDLPLEGRIILARYHILEKNYEQAKQVIESLPSSSNESTYIATIFALLVNDYKTAQSNVDLITQSASNDRFKQAGLSLKQTFEVFDTFEDSPRSYLLTLSGQNLIEHGEYALARSILFEALAEQNGYRDAWVLIGYSYLKSKLRTESIQALEKALTFDPYFANTHLYLGLAYELNNQPNKSIESLNQSLAQGATNQKDIFEHLANNYFALQNYELAAQNYSKASQLGQLTLPTYTRLIWTYLEPLASPQAALLTAKKALEEYPDDKVALNLIGWAELNNQNYGEAEAYLKSAIQKDLNYEAPNLNLGVLFAQTGETEKAKTYLNKAIQLATQNGATSIKQRAEAELQNLTQPQNE